MHIDARIALAVSGVVGVVAFAAGALFGADGPPARGAGQPTVQVPVDLRPIEQSLDELREMLATSDNALAPVLPGGGRDVPGGQLATVLERLDRIEELLAEGAASPATAAGRRPGWRAIETDLRSLRRPTDIAELHRFIDEHKDDIEHSRVPFVLSLMGVREVIDRFGWPEQIEMRTTGGSYELTYRIHPATASSQGTFQIVCTVLGTTTTYAYFED